MEFWACNRLLLQVRRRLPVRATPLQDQVQERSSVAACEKRSKKPEHFVSTDCDDGDSKRNERVIEHGMCPNRETGGEKASPTFVAACWQRVSLHPLPRIA